MLRFMSEGRVHLNVFFAIFTMSVLCLPVCVPGDNWPSEMESAFKGKNLLPLEQILCFKKQSFPIKS